MNQHFERIRELIEQNGPMGVNAIQREINVPLSTLQKYLERQDYFKKNDSRKWDLPERVIQSISPDSTNVIANSIEANIGMLKAQTIETLKTLELLQSSTNNLSRIIALQPPIPTNSPPVAKTPVTPQNKHVKVYITGCEKFTTLIKSHLKNVPERYLDLMKNLDVYSLIIMKGLDWANSIKTKEIMDLLLGNVDELSDEMTEVLINHQKEGK